MSTLKLSTGQDYNTHLKQDLVSMPKKAISAVGSGIRSATFGLAGGVVGDLFGETAGGLVSALGQKSSKKKDDKERSWGDAWQIIKAEMKGLLKPIEEKKEEEKKSTAKKVPAAPGNIDVASFVAEITKASHEETARLIEEKGITDEKIIAKLKEAEMAALEEIGKALYASHGKDGLTVEHLKNIESNTQQLLGLMGKSEEEKFEANKPTAQKVAVQALSENENSPLGGLFASFKKLAGMFGGLGSLVSSFGGALTTAMSVISKLPMKGLATGALAAVAIDSLTDAYNSFKTGESNKYADAANNTAEALGLIDKGQTIGTAAYDAKEKLLGFFGLSDQDKEDTRLKEALKPVYEKMKAGKKVPEQLVSDVERLYGEKVPLELIQKKTAIASPTNTASPQTEAAAEVVSGAAQLSAIQEKQAAPIIIPVPTPQAASKASEDVLNYVTTNGESTFRRLSDRLFSTAFV